MIQILNLRTDKPQFEYDIICDRTSIFGNPFYLKKESDRNIVCDNYVSHFKSLIRNDLDVREQFLKMVNLYQKHGKLRLFCWCFPKRCHVETIKEAILLKLSISTE